jgi:hypothetical protein
MDYNRNYIIFDVSELDKVNFNEIIENSVDTLRYSLDHTKTFVKWDGVEPSFLNELTTKSQTYNVDEINNILIGPDWSPKYD